MFDLADHAAIPCISATGRLGDGGTLRFAGDSRRSVTTILGADGRFEYCQRLLDRAETLRPVAGKADAYQRFRPALAPEAKEHHWADPFGCYRLQGCPLEEFVAAAAGAFEALRAPSSAAGWPGVCGLACTPDADGRSMRLSLRPFPGAGRRDHLPEAVLDLGLGCLLEVTTMRMANAVPISRLVFSEHIEVHGVPLPRTITLTTWPGSAAGEQPSSERRVTFAAFADLDPAQLAAQGFEPAAGATVAEVVK